MTEQQKKTIYLFLFLLLATALLLAACDTAADTVSAAPIDSVVVEEAAEPVEAAETSSLQETIPDTAAIIIESAASGETDPGSGASVDSTQGYGPGQGVHVTPEGELSADEIAALLHMREEEKLARDVYQTLYDIWGVPVFANISGSEQAHMDAITYLMDAYGLQDPAAGNAVVQFENANLQALYDDLIAQGQRSPQDALLAGAAIEEIDILDLQERLARTDNEAVIQVFENLLAGSENHLDALAMNLERQTGTDYEPQYIGQDAYDALTSTTSGRGNGPGGFNNGGAGSGNSAAPGSGSGTGNGSNSGQNSDSAPRFGNGGGNGLGQGNGNGRGRNN